MEERFDHKNTQQKNEKKIENLSAKDYKTKFALRSILLFIVRNLQDAEMLLEITNDFTLRWNLYILIGTGGRNMKALKSFTCFHFYFPLEYASKDLNEYFFLLKRRSA